MLIEHSIQNQIRAWCGEHNILCFRCNVGRVLTAQNTYFDTGLVPGFSDLLLCYEGKTIFCECKTATGKQRQDQINFQRIVEAHGFTYIIARCVEDVVKCIYKDGDNYATKIK